MADREAYWKCPCCGRLEPKCPKCGEPIFRYGSHKCDADKQQQEVARLEAKPDADEC